MPRTRILALHLLALPGFVWIAPSGASRAAAPESHPEVLVVYDAGSATSRAIAAYYATRRGVPAANRLGLALPHDDGAGAPETVSRAFFETHLRDPIAAFLRERDLVDRIQVIALAQGMPLRVTGPHVPDRDLLHESTRASVDAELALLFSGLDGSAGIEGMQNPYFDSERPFAEFRAANPEAPLRYLVARLDGYPTPVDPETGLPADVRSLVDRAHERAAFGTWLVDEDPEQPPGYFGGNHILLAPAAATLRALGLLVFHDRIAAFRGGVAGIAGYASWGSNDGASPGAPFYGEIDGRRYPGTFAARAIAVTLVSTNARSFAYPAQYGQSLVADLVREGVAGAAGHVFEPTLPAVARPQIVLSRYARGVPAGEAFYRGLPYLGWMNVWVGDPLMRVESPVLRAPEDLDGDGVADADDDCTRLPNPDQRDTDGDGFGNLCDADFDGDGIVGTSWSKFPYGDMEELRIRKLKRHYGDDYDLDGDGHVDARDDSIAQMMLLFPPGPKGR